MIRTTHCGRLPNPTNVEEIMAARARDDKATFISLAVPQIAANVRKQQEIGIDIMSDGEFWKARDQKYYGSRATGIEARPLQPGETSSIVPRLRERAQFPEYFAAYDRMGNTPTPAMKIPEGPAYMVGPRYVLTGPLEPLPPTAIAEDIAMVKQGIEAAGGAVSDFFYPVLGPGWLGHFVWNEYYKTDEEYVYAMASLFKNDYKAVVDAGFTLQVDDPGLLDKWPLFNPPISLEEYRKQAQLRIEATNWALEGIPEERVRYHSCWGSWHTPHTEDLPLGNVVDLLLMVKARYYSIEAADVQHQLDYQVWEETKLPDGKVYVPGVIAHKTSTVEPPALVAHRICQYANLMGRDNVIAGVDCGPGGRVYPEVAWAKLRSLVEGAALATKQLWG
jgi:5-methyltetrahydropteroyltriglutamate--homocysteine methyltransferase